MALTAKQQAFVDEYLVTLNAADAARKAGYSAKTASQIGHELLQKPAVAAAIGEAQDRRAERTHVSQDDVIGELAAVAFSDIRGYVSWNGAAVTLKPSANLESAAAVLSVSGDGEKAQIRLHDKIRALELLGRHVGLWKEGGLPEGKIEVTVVWPEQAET